VSAAAGGSPAPPGQGGQTVTPPEPDGTSAPAKTATPEAPGTAAATAQRRAPAQLTAPAPPQTGAVRPQAGRWAAGAARYAPAAAAAVVMAVLGVWGLARDSAMGNDEVATRWAALLPLRELAHLLNTVDAVHGFYYLLMHGWMAVGTSPAVMRIPSVVAAVAAVAMTAVLARRLTGSGWAALFAGLVMALTPAISYYAQTARSYAFVLACVVASTLVLLHALDAEVAGAPGRQVARRWVAYGALVTLGGYLNEMSLLVLAAHAVTVLLARYGRPAVRHWATAAASAVVLVLPLLAVSVREHGAIAWIPRPGLTALRILFQDYFGATMAVAVLLFAFAVVAVLPPDGWLRRRRDSAGGGEAPGGGSGPVPAAAAGVPWWRAGGISLPSVAVPLLVVPAALLIGESLVAHPLYVDRYVLYGEAGAALLAGAGIYRIGRWLGDATHRRALVWVPGVVACVCALVLQIGPQQRARTPQSRSFDFGSASRYVGARERPGDGVLFFPDFYRKARLGYPADFAETSDFAMAVSPVQAGDFRGTDKPSQVTGPLMLGYQRIWVIGHVPSPRLKIPALRAESIVLETHFTRIGERLFRGMTVTLWLRHAAGP
jgi:mannosyltransferase